MSILFQLSISFALLFSAMSSFPTGAPLDRCDSMFPGHGVDPIDGQAPYEILVKPKGSEVDVTIRSQEEGFKGFLIEARGRWDGKAIGTWKTSERCTKTIDCFDSPSSAVTHHLKDDLDSDGKKRFTELNFQWVPPASDKLNRVKFIATIVKSFHNIYMNVSTQIKLKEFF